MGVGAEGRGGFRRGNRILVLDVLSLQNILNSQRVDIKVAYIGLEFKDRVQAGDINLGVISTWKILKALCLEEIIMRVVQIREEAKDRTWGDLLLMNRSDNV